MNGPDPAGSRPRLGVVVDLDALDLLRLAEASQDRWTYVWVLDTTEQSSPVFPLLHRFGEIINVADADDHQAVEQVREVALDGITCFSDVSLERTAHLSDALGLRFHPPAAARKLTDKFRQRTALRSAGFDHPNFIEIDGDLDGCALERRCAGFVFPGICKPVRGMSSIDVARVADLNQLSEHLRSIAARGEARTMILESELVGFARLPRMPTFVSVECALIDGEFEAIGVRGKMDQSGFRSTGALMPAELDEQTVADVTECARRAAAACQATNGVLHIEIKLTASGPEIVEVNGRVGGRGVPELIRRQTASTSIRSPARSPWGFRSHDPLRWRGRACRTSSACKHPLALASPSTRGRSKFAARFGVDEVAVNQWESLGDPLWLVGYVSHDHRWRRHQPRPGIPDLQRHARPDASLLAERSRGTAAGS